jgi:hypothetical protein
MLQFVMGPAAAHTFAKHPQWFTEAGFLRWAACRAGIKLQDAGIRRQAPEVGDLDWADRGE